MTGTQFHGTAREFSAKEVNTAIADALTAIKGDDYTDAEIGRILVKSEDRIRDYRLDRAGMSAATFMRACVEFSPLFGDRAFAPAKMRLLPLDASCDTDDGALPKLTMLLLKASQALEAGTITPAAARGMLSDVEAAQGVMDRIRRLAAL